MRDKIFLFLLLLLMSCATKAEVDSLTVEYLEEVELTSIMARTAGFREYCTDFAEAYNEETSMWFTPFADHPAIHFLQDLRDRYHVSHDALASLALHLQKNTDGYVLRDNTEELSARWSAVDKDSLLDMINAFYKDSHFHDFFEQHQTFYEEQCRLFANALVDSIDTRWLEHFHGAVGDHFHIVLAFTNGRHNYGPSLTTKSEKENYAIAGYVTPRLIRLNGFTPHNLYGDMIVHEFNHSFINPLLRDSLFRQSMRPLGEEMLRRSYHTMTNMQYGRWDIVVNETLVRATTLLYKKAHGCSPTETERLIHEEESHGFRWMTDVVASLEYYEQHRSNYPTLRDYYPKLTDDIRRALFVEF
ncbi:MAG: DUF4932 domain-containing protein [Prevotella sp.]|nr:DUF4932 domain-containing protein [Prevotella sp.]